MYTHQVVLFDFKDKHLIFYAQSLCKHYVDILPENNYSRVFNRIFEKKKISSIVIDKLKAIILQNMEFQKKNCIESERLTYYFQHTIEDIYQITVVVSGNVPQFANMLQKYNLS